VLDRRIPHIERAGEAQIAADAKELRASVNLRIALMRHRAQNLAVAHQGRDTR